MDTSVNIFNFVFSHETRLLDPRSPELFFFSIFLPFCIFDYELH